MKALRLLENAILRFASANTVFYKRAMLLNFYVEHIESGLAILSYPESTMGPEKNFQNQGSQKAGK